MTSERAGEVEEPERPICLLTGGHVYVGVRRTPQDDGTVRVDSHCARCDRAFVNIEKRRRRG